MRSKIISLYLLFQCCLDTSKGFTSAVTFFGLNLLSRLLDYIFQKKNTLTAYLINNQKLFASYRQWIIIRENRKKAHIELLDYRPLISIILPVYNPDFTYFRLCIESVLKQEYEHWELCIADDFSQVKVEHISYINALVETKKIKFIQRKENGHISHCSNTAMNLATGEFVLLLDQDDLLPVNCLKEFVYELNANRSLDFIYSDEDVVVGSKRSEPAFKPSFSPHNLLSRNYITHAALIRTDVVKRLGGFRPGYEGSQDHDLFLRIQKITNEIGHIPKVLYHWRSHSDSTSKDIQIKPYIAQASQKALADYLGSSELIIGSVSETHPNYYHFYNPGINQDKFKIVNIDISTPQQSESGVTDINGFFNLTEILNTNDAYILFLGVDIEIPDEKFIAEGISILHHTNAVTVGGAVIYKSKMAPSAYYLMNGKLESFYAGKKYPFVGYHGFGLSFSNADAVNPLFWFVKTEALRKFDFDTDESISFINFAQKVFTSSIASGSSDHVFAPQLHVIAGEAALKASEKIYQHFSRQQFAVHNSKHLSPNIGITKSSYFFR